MIIQILRLVFKRRRLEIMEKRIRRDIGVLYSGFGAWLQWMGDLSWLGSVLWREEHGE